MQFSIVWLNQDVHCNASLWVKEGQESRRSVGATVTDLTVMAVPLAEVGLDDIVAEAGSLERRIEAFRPPEKNYCLENAARVEVLIAYARGNPFWICVVTEAGVQA